MSKFTKRDNRHGGPDGATLIIEKASLFTYNEDLIMFNFIFCMLWPIVALFS